MTKRNSTKKALLMSAMSLLLCFSMLIGTTFAWFTDSVTSAGNIIKSGDLEVLMHWADGTKAFDNTADWKDASAEAIFNYKLWEPGYVDVKHIKITNNGSLALKYQLFIEPTGEVQDLADVIDVYVIKGGETIADRTSLAGKKPVGTLSEVIDSFQTLVYGDITKNAEYDIFTIALKMREGASSEYENKQIGSEFAVKVLATQFAYEGDSFDEKYDEDALFAVADGLYVDNTDGSYVALNEDGLSSMSALASEDPSITSVTYVTEDGEVEVPVLTSASALSSAAKSKEEIVVLTSGSYTVPTTMAAGQEISIVGNEDTEINIIGGHVNPSGGGATVNFSGVTINASGYTNGLGNGTKATYTNCTFNAADMYLYGASTFINCTFNDCGTYALWTWGASTAEFIGCTFNSTGKALYVNANVLDNGTNHQTVIITDCKFYDTGVNDIQKAAIETGDDYGSKSYDIIITNTTVEGFAITEDKTGTKNYGGNNFGTNVWGNKYQMGTDKLNVVIDGDDVY